ncbi:hypothetical protein D3C81_2149640 [compost metagenome]
MGIFGVTNPEYDYPLALQLGTEISTVLREMRGKENKVNRDQPLWLKCNSESNRMINLI